MREELTKINKMFHDGSIRYEGDLDRLENREPIEVAQMVAERHPFTDGNKRTAIKFMELKTGEKVPEFVYKILEKAQMKLY